MKILFILSLTVLVGTCSTPKYTVKIQNVKDSIEITDSTLISKFANTITEAELKVHLYEFASDKYEGRKVGEKGQKLAAEFLKTYYQDQQIKSPFGGDNYFQMIPESFFSNDIKSTENVLAYIKGTTTPQEVIIISSHLDHLGITDDGKINNGADDDGSGTVALMEMAQAFNMAKQAGYGPKRSILFLHLTAEEIGEQGAVFYVNHPIFPLENTVVDLNIDMIGRVDKFHENDENYIYLIGVDRLSKELLYLSEKVNNTFYNINIDYRFNAENDHNHYFERSDHYQFALKGIPVIFYFNGVHDDYHRPSDTPDKIDYPLLAKRTKLIFSTAWQIANQENRLVTDENNKLLK
ncbi:M28 family peptidase [uncultured Algibacter sp.]|uniref:M28 family peptidase n=1 Tax=uncultured Algibacter sp. TaxID=298659 RepID=UPI002617AD88|nr:M28 family peptidase [uncultured Algibacter sp.]